MSTSLKEVFHIKVAAKISFKSWKRSVFTEVNEWAPKVHLLLYKNLEPSVFQLKSRHVDAWLFTVSSIFLRAVECLKNKKKTIKVGTFSKYRKTINYFEWPFSPICTDFRMGTKYEFWLHLKIDLNYRIICRTCSLHIIYLYYTYMYLVGHEYKLHC